MFFKKKQKNEAKCPNCRNLFSDKYNFCPYCGQGMMDAAEERKELGLLGKTDLTDKEMARNLPLQGETGIMDKLLSSMVNNLMKNMMSEMENAEVSTLPNGVKIRIGIPQKKQSKAKPPVVRSISEEQLKKMSSLPRAKAQTNVKRIGNKIIYELNIPGITSSDDIFVSKIESGYEIKAIGEKQVYVNSLPINLPIKRFLIDADKLLVEFSSQDE